MGHLIVFIVSYLQHLTGQRFDKFVLYFLNYRSFTLADYHGSSMVYGLLRRGSEAAASA